MDPFMEYLIRTVKYCILDIAFNNGESLADCIGPISKKVSFNDKVYPVIANITDNDVEKFSLIKQQNFPH